jgi:hypothetical protein
VAGFCEHGYEPLGFIICWEFVVWLSYCWLLKKEWTLWNYVMRYLNVATFMYISLNKRLNDFRGQICSLASVSPTFSSVSTVLFDCFFMSHTTLWELASQDIYDGTYGYIFCKFFSLQKFRQ